MNKLIVDESPSKTAFLSRSLIIQTRELLFPLIRVKAPKLGTLYIMNLFTIKPMEMNFY